MIRAGKAKGRSVSLTHFYYVLRSAWIELWFHATDMISGGFEPFVGFEKMREAFTRLDQTATAAVVGCICLRDNHGHQKAYIYNIIYIYRQSLWDDLGHLVVWCD